MTLEDIQRIYPQATRAPRQMCPDCGGSGQSGANLDTLSLLPPNVAAEVQALPCWCILYETAEEAAEALRARAGQWEGTR